MKTSRQQQIWKIFKAFEKKHRLNLMTQGVKITLFVRDKILYVPKISSALNVPKQFDFKYKQSGDRLNS